VRAEPESLGHLRTTVRTRRHRRLG
jgi:hypothetical protein